METSRRVILDLLMCIWDLLLDNPDRPQDKGRQRIGLEKNGKGGELVAHSYTLFPQATPFLNPQVSIDIHSPFTAKWAKPSEQVMSLALNSYKLHCFESTQHHVVKGNLNSEPINYGFKKEWEATFGSAIIDWKDSRARLGIPVPGYVPVSSNLGNLKQRNQTDEEWAKMKNPSRQKYQTTDRVKEALEADKERDREPGRVASSPSEDGVPGRVAPSPSEPKSNEPEDRVPGRVAPSPSEPKSNEEPSPKI